MKVGTCEGALVLFSFPLKHTLGAGNWIVYSKYAAELFGMGHP